MSALAAACGGFLLAVLWMDLMFDVQALPHRSAGAVVPEPVLASIAGYYRRVTTTASPMGHLVGTVMVVLLATLAFRAARDPRAAHFLALVATVPPVVLAAVRVVPNAVRLGARTDPPERQSELARAILRDHAFCFAAIAAFLVLELSPR